MPVAVNPKVYEKAASIGHLRPFVGSLDGRTGVDDDDDGDDPEYAALGPDLAFKQQPPVFSGTPRSLTERMMMDEWAARSSRRRKSGS